MQEYIIELSSDDENALSIIAKAYNLHELIRCRNCKWFEVHPANQLFGWEESFYCNNPRLTDQEGISTNGRNWYCADGEART